MTELTSGIKFADNTHIYYKAYFDQYYYSGRYDSAIEKTMKDLEQIPGVIFEYRYF